MRLNRAELRKIMYDFNSVSNRLLQADFNDHSGVLSKFVNFIKTTPIIYDYVSDCGTCNQNIEEEIKEVSNSYGRCIFSLGDTNEEEVCNVFAILDYITEKNISVCFGIGGAYTTSSKYQDRVKAFNDRVVMVLIRHIENYLTKVGIDMGIDEKVTYSITVSNGQVNIANDSATITANNNVGLDIDQLERLISNVRNTATGLSDGDAEVMSDSLEAIEDQVKAKKPKKGVIKTAITALKTLKGTVEFAAAIAALIQFVQAVL